MVSRHPLLRYLAVMVLAVLLPCMSDAATPLEVTPASYATTTQVRSLLDKFLDENALNMIFSFSLQFSTVTEAGTTSGTLKQNYPAASVSQSGVYVTVGQISGFTVYELVSMMTPYIYSYPSNMNPKGNLKILLYYSSSSEASSSSKLFVSGFYKSLKSDVPTPTSPVSAVVVVKTTPEYTQVQSFIKTFRADDVHNRVSGFGVRFTSNTYADATVVRMMSIHPAPGITRRSDQDIGVSELSGFNLNAYNDVVNDAVFGTFTDVTLNFGSKSAADATIALVNSGLVPGLSSAEKQVSDDYFLPLGGIIGIVIAVIVVDIVVAVGVYWKFLKSSGREVKDDMDNVLL